MGHPSFGKLFPCQVCNADTLTVKCGLNPDERLIRFEEIQTVGRPGAAAMVKAAKAFVDGGMRGYLSLHGGFGNGKSTTMKAIVNACIDAGVLDVRYITMTEVMVYAREAFESQQAGDSDYGRIAKLAKTRVLLIDELDKARVSDYAREVQTYLFDVRYRFAQDFGTVVAWNGAFSALDLPWLRSRFSEFPVVENKDVDMRPLLGGA